MTSSGASKVPDAGAGALSVGPGRVDAGPRPLIRWRGWRPALWVSAVVAMLITWSITFVVSAFQTLLHAGVCNEPAAAADLAEAQRALVLLAVAVAVPWAVALWRTRHRLRVAVFTGLALAPAAMGAVQALVAAPADYTMSWCLY